MIEGSLSDVSLPGLLQFLATESNKSFKVSLTSGGQKGEILVCEGEILSAIFGLLEGNDALTELLFWPEGLFSVVLLGGDEKTAGKGNLKIPLRQVNTFADQMFYLREAAVGLNSEIVPSPSFGTQAWQEALAKQPLFKEDYAVLGWITDGRTMRQAMREFSFDVVSATSSLFRLLSTGSVEILRPTLAVEDIGGEVPMSGLAAILDNILPDGEATFDASPGGEKEEDKAEVAAEAKSESKADAKSESKSDAKVEDKADSKDGKENKGGKPDKEVSASKSDDTEENVIPTKGNGAEELANKDYDRDSGKDSGKDDGKKSHSESPSITSSRLVKESANDKQSDVGTATGATFNAVGGTMELPSTSQTLIEPKADIDSNPFLNPVADPVVDPLAETLATASSPDTLTGPVIAEVMDMGGSRDVITCDSLPAVGSDEFNDIIAKAQKASMEEPDPNAPTSQAVTAQIHLPTSFRTSSDKLPVVSNPLAPESIPIATAAAMARQTIDMDVPKVALPSTAPKTLPGSGSGASPSIPAKAPLVDSASAWAAAVRVDVQPPAAATSPSSTPTSSSAASSSAASSSAAASAEESPEKRLFDIVRTDPLPIVAIDIERLFQTNFHVSPFGHVSINNDVLDSDLKKIMMEFKAGKNFINVATESDIAPDQVLHYCKYCLERGYIDPPDAVTGLTADLLLGRVELEQYLLQRRRITGDELRDVVEVAKQKGIKLTDLLVKLGFMTNSDWDRLCQEKERFARR